MIKKLFKKATIDDLLKELKSSTFKEDKVNSMLEHLNINHVNQNNENFLHLMILNNKIESAKWLVKNGIDINYQDSKGNSPLMLACKDGFLSAIDLLLEKNANVNLENYSGYTAIDFAVYNGHFPAYKKLKPLVKDLNKKNKKNESILHFAVKSQNLQIIDDLLEEPKFINDDSILFYKESFENINILNTLLDRFNSLKKLDHNGRNLLFYVIENGFECHNIFLKLLEDGLDINCIDKKGNNILLHLIEYIIYKENNLVIDTKEDVEKHKKDIKNLIDIIPIIIESNIDTTIVNNDNETVLSLSAKNQHLKLLNLLLDCEVPIDIVDKNNNTALSLIIEKGNSYLETIHLLLDYGINPNIRNSNNHTVIEKLIDAILIVREEKKAKPSQRVKLDFKSDYVSILESVLVNTDVKLKQYNSKDEPYFFEALRYGATDIVKLLIKYGADINAQDKDGNNIIYKYMLENQEFKKEKEQRNYYNNLQAIIIMGANVNAKDSYGGITLHKAILDCDITVIKMLLHSGVDMNAIDNRGRHILHNAVWKNDIKIFKLIYSYNKSLLNEPDKFGVLPINYAAFLGYTDMVLEFIELSAHVNNPYKKTKYILNFLKKFHKSLDTLILNARTKIQKDKIKVLVENMKKEFEVNP
ncbi:ankyrin repeat domain-containing protein [Arcobacter arenosus]|jgi:ankyrin repeat protein|uniref:ankyrin repeat domain-containing protein n=1 Tax=Arcobacter arenosus TaxID=2576037 RepID=UPI003BAD5441